MKLLHSFWLRLNPGPFSRISHYPWGFPFIGVLPNPAYMNGCVSKIICRLTCRHQRNKLKLDDVPKLPEWQRLRLQHSSNDMSVPNLVIRRASVIQGHGDIYQARKNSGGKMTKDDTL
jgi:hypothetical protein